MLFPDRFVKASQSAMLAALAWALSAGLVRAQDSAALPADALQRFEARLQALEEENRALREQVRELAGSREPSIEEAPAADPASVLGLDVPGTRPDGEDAREALGAPISRGGPAGAAASAAASADAAEERGALGGPTARVGPTAPAYNTRGVGKRMPLKAWLGQGFELSSEDDEFQLQFHNETQVDYRFFDHTGQGTVHNGFFIPRQIWTFNGRFTRNVEYLASFQRGLSTFELRDTLVNFKVLDKDRFMIKAGRFKTPYTYEFYTISNPDLIAPERSVFNLNFSNHRKIGVMGWGLLADDRVDYAAGIFNGGRGGFEAMVDEPSVAAYLNFRPFRHSERFKYLNFLNFGASVDVSDQGNNTGPPIPMRTAVNASLASGASTASPAFLSFNNGAREDGIRSMGTLHAAWFYKRLSFMADLDRGVVNYTATPDAPPFARVGVPVDAYTLQGGFFLTGEHVTRRGPIEIKRPFNLKRGADFGLGAVELGARYATLRLGGEVFSTGLADPNLWTNNVQVIDVGFNWHLNQYLKVYFDWQHAEFGDPVTFGAGQFLTNSELFWMRLQLLF